MLQRVCLAAFCANSTVAMAQEPRHADAHEHGVSTVEIALEDQKLVVDVYAPGMDIVGFEYEAESAADRDTVAGAIRQLSRPEQIVSLPDAAGCRLAEVLAHLYSGEEEHGETHDHAADADYGDDEHAEKDARHSEFHARYAFTCDTPDALTEIGFPFFEVFANAEEIEARYVTGSGAGATEVRRDAATVTFD